MEFNEIGAHCELKNCNQKDFLPFECEFCHKKFCLEHRLPIKHNCQKYIDDNNIVLFILYIIRIQI